MSGETVLGGEMDAATFLDQAQDVAKAFRAAVAAFDRSAPVLVLSHNDADGLSAAALFARAFAADGWLVRTRVVGRGESPWSDEMRAELADWLWLAAVGLIGDMAEDAGFPEMAEARRYGITALREAASLVNAPRRSASGDASTALALLLTADGPREITKGDRPEAAALRAAKAEVKAELDAARRIGPKVRGDVALIRFSSQTQIHPLIAQQWRGRLKNEIVLAANTG